MSFQITFSPNTAIEVLCNHEGIAGAVFGAIAAKIAMDHLLPDSSQNLKRMTIIGSAIGGANSGQKGAIECGAIGYAVGLIYHAVWSGHNPHSCKCK